MVLSDREGRGRLGRVRALMGAVSGLSLACCSSGLEPSLEPTSAGFTVNVVALLSTSVKVRGSNVLKMGFSGATRRLNVNLVGSALEVDC